MLPPIKKKINLSMTHLWTESIILCFEEKMHNVAKDFFLQEYALYCHHTFEKIAFPTCSAQQTCPEMGIVVSFTNTPVFTPSSWSQFCTCRASMNPHPILKQEQGTYYCWNDHPTQHVGLSSSKQGTEDEIFLFKRRLVQKGQG